MFCFMDFRTSQMVNVDMALLFTFGLFNYVSIGQVNLDISFCDKSYLENNWVIPLVYLVFKWFDYLQIMIIFCNKSYLTK